MLFDDAKIAAVYRAIGRLEGIASMSTDDHTRSSIYDAVEILDTEIDAMLYRPSPVTVPVPEVEAHD